MVSEACLGTMTFGVQNSKEDAFEQLDFAIDSGVNFIDTAEAYGFGRSEKLTKWAVEKAGLKIGQVDGEDEIGRMVVATKFAPVPWRPGAESVVNACRASNERLGVEACDLYQSK